MYMNNLAGTIPDSLYNITSLKVLSLSNNVPGLSGTINSKIGNLLKLEELDLHNNEFLKGTVPSELGLCHNLSKNKNNEIASDVICIHAPFAYLIFGLITKGKSKFITHS